MTELAFCNDIDMADWPTLMEVHSIVGERFGLPVEDSFWLFDPLGSDMALFRGNMKEKGPRHDEILEEIKKGRLAILHSAGNFSRGMTALRPCRGLVAEALAYLAEMATMPAVWTNHGDQGDIQNIGGGQPSYHQGDAPESDVYLIDLLLQYGLRYFWTDRHYSNKVFSFSSRMDDIWPLLVRERTPSGQEITCFHRYRGNLPKAPDAQTLHFQLSDAHMKDLIQKNGVTIIYQHWCVHRDETGRPFTAGRPVFPPASMAALERLATLHHEGSLVVRSVTQLLDRCAGLGRRKSSHVD